jgi:stress response protein YsnF
MLARDEVQVEKVIINQQIDAIPPVREEGDTIVVPVVEEILVVERRLMLKEEIIVRRMHRTERYQEKVKLRRQEAEVTRLPVDESR